MPEATRIGDFEIKSGIVAVPGGKTIAMARKQNRARADLER